MQNICAMRALMNDGILDFSIIPLWPFDARASIVVSLFRYFHKYVCFGMGPLEWFIVPYYRLVMGRSIRVGSGRLLWINIMK